MDEIDLGLHELSNQLSQDKAFFAESSTTKANPLDKSRYMQLMKTYFFYWTTAVFLFIFIIWASPEYCYTMTVHRNNQPPTKQFLWSRFTTVFTISYVIIISLYLTSIYIFNTGALKVQ